MGDGFAGMLSRVPSNGERRRVSDPILFEPPGTRMTRMAAYQLGPGQTGIHLALAGCAVILMGLQPLLPQFDHLVTMLISDPEQHGLLDDCVVLATGELGGRPRAAHRGVPTGGITGHRSCRWPWPAASGTDR